jgi:HTH-type transcriptional regulator/antitoxin HigA
MMQAALVENDFVKRAVIFAEEVDAYTHVKNEAMYEKALEMVSKLMDIAPDDPTSTLNNIISSIAKSISIYEDTLEDVKAFEKAVSDMPADISMLRLLMDQHELNGTDFPEIGDKTLVSKILKGDRNLTKDHIVKLSERFDISPALFFD